MERNHFASVSTVVCLAPQHVPGAIVEELLELANRLAEDGAWWESRAAFCAAVAADETPVSRLLFAGFLADSGKYDEAHGHLTAAWERSKAIGSAEFRAICCESLATFHRQQGAADQAARYQQRAIRAWCDVESREGCLPVSVFRGLSWDSLHRGEVAEARGWLVYGLRNAAVNDSVETLEFQESANEGDEFDRGESAWILANIALWEGELQSRRQYLAGAYRSFCNQGDHAGCAAVLMELGRSLLDRSDWTSAGRCFEQAGKLQSRLGNSAAEKECRHWERHSLRWAALEFGDPQWN